MHSVDSVFAAMRLVHEGGEATLDRLAVIANRSLRGVETRAQAEGWTGATIGSLTARRKRVETQYDRLITEIERLTISDEGGSLTFDKGRVDTIMAMVKALEKIGETMRSDEDAKDKQIKSDAELAAALQRIDDRIYEIAFHHAGELGETKSERR